jgi:hypothetical protein
LQSPGGRKGSPARRGGGPRARPTPHAPPGDAAT